jgi:hypothetical protein
MSNRLARERSPYLLQHANNPVDWFPWAAEAFTKARAEQKPIFLSIGYSTCHWCHVMEHESFEDPSIAGLLNKDFVSIKVDREERPDVDRVYMAFVQATTGAGGWPMSVWLTPELKPFFGGTYFPPTTRWGRPGFSEVLAQVGRAWRDERDRVLASATALVDRLRQATAGDDAAPDRAPVASRAAVDAGVAAFRESFDARHGGFGGAPKFPRPSELLFLLGAHALSGDQAAKTMAVDTVQAMALGGIHDHVGGGFHRYSVDAEWRVPHFEKMLYDQAQIVMAALEAGQASGEAIYGMVAEDTLDYVLRELTAPDGAFFSAEDADSLGIEAGAAEKREGAFYVWSAAEIDRLFGADAEVVRRRFGIEDRGNAPADPQGEFVNQNILYIAQTIEDVATRSGRSVDEVMQVIGRSREILFDARASRPRPHLDDKVITAWNGLMIAAFARAARTLAGSPRRADWLLAATRAAESAHAHLWRPGDKRLWRRFRDGEAAIDAFCEDYAFLAWGLIELFQSTGDARWLTWARELTEVETALFWDERDGGWFSTTGQDETVLLRLKEDYDGAEPAAASVTVRNLLVLGHLVSDPALVDRARRTLERYGSQIGRVARVMPFMLLNVARWHGRASQVVIAGVPARADTLALEQAIASQHLPWAVQIGIGPDGVSDSLARALPWLGAMRARDGHAAAYLCHDFTCQAPTADPLELARALREAGQPNRII